MKNEHFPSQKEPSRRRPERRSGGIQEAFQEKTDPVVLPKAKTRAEVIRRMKLKEDRELAERVVKEAMLYLEEFYRVKKERF